jgi:hypothetical protein
VAAGSASRRHAPKAMAAAISIKAVFVFIVLVPSSNCQLAWTR